MNKIQRKINSFLERVVDKFFRLTDKLDAGLEKVYGTADSLFDIFRYLGIIHDSRWRRKFSMGAKILAAAGYEACQDNNQRGGYSLAACSTGDKIDIGLKVHRYIGLVVISSTQVISREKRQQMINYAQKRNYKINFPTTWNN